MMNRIWFAVTLAGAVFCALPDRIMAQPGPTPAVRVLVGGPIQVGMNDRALVCATNLGSTPVSVTMELVDATTGMVVLRQNADLGSPAVATGPGGGAGACLDSATAGRAIIGILIGRVVAVNPQPLPPSPPPPDGVVASLQVFGVGTSAAPLNPRYVALVPLHPPQPCSAGH